jgi:transposase
MTEHKHQQRITELELQLEQIQSRNTYLEEQFRLTQQKHFGASSESHPGQGELFNEAEVEIEQTVEVAQETIEYTRNKAKRKPYLKIYPAK